MVAAKTVTLESEIERLLADAKKLLGKGKGYGAKREELLKGLIKQAKVEGDVVKFDLKGLKVEGNAKKVAGELFKTVTRLKDEELEKGLEHFGVSAAKVVAKLAHIGKAEVTTLLAHGNAAKLGSRQKYLSQALENAVRVKDGVIRIAGHGEGPEKEMVEKVAAAIKAADGAKLGKEGIGAIGITKEAIAKSLEHNPGFFKMLSFKGATGTHTTLKTSGIILGAVGTIHAIKHLAAPGVDEEGKPKERNVAANLAYLAASLGVIGVSARVGSVAR